MSLLVVVPTRGRPRAAAQMLAACEATIRGDTLVVLCTDDDDPSPYAGLIRRAPRAKIGQILNDVALAQGPELGHVGFMGDDHRPRTAGWDVELLTDGVAYGNDLFQGASLPTSVVMSMRVVRKLGYFVPPTLGHFYIDNAWKDIGQAIGDLTYRPDIVIEHLHPTAGKAEWDDLYLANNSPAQWDADEAAYNRWRTEQLPLIGPG